MRRLPVLIFAAAIAVWGLASIPDGISADKSSSVDSRRAALAAPVQNAGTLALRAERPGSSGEAAGNGECVQLSLDERSSR